jgi:hypothetical protein
MDEIPRASPPREGGPPTPRAEVVRLALAFAAAKREAVHHDRGFDSFAEYTASLGYGAKPSKDLLDLGRVLRRIPELQEAVASGEVSFGAARELDPVARDADVLCLPPGAARPIPAPEAPMRRIGAVKGRSSTEVAALVEEAVERARAWPDPVFPKFLKLTRKQIEEFDRARGIASELHERPISRSEFLGMISEYYCEAFDTDEPPRNP